MRFAELEGKRVAIWGCGREGRAALAALSRSLPGLRPTVLCKAEEAARLAQRDGVRVLTEPPGAEVLAAFDVVIKSPGISIYKPEVVAAQSAGTLFTSGTALWFGENPEARVVAVTGTKGKSTTAALLAHLARSLGVRTALAGNIGLPLLELDGMDAELWVIELSSFQTGEAGSLELAVFTSLDQEHLDWHGSIQRYHDDKLRLAACAAGVLIPAGHTELASRTVGHPRRLEFGGGADWHVQDSTICRGERVACELAVLKLPGVHNADNACAALAAVDALGLDALGAAPALATFQALPHRLQPLGQRDGVSWVNDSISTTPASVLAALDSLPDAEISLILGGYDRGLDWSALAASLALRGLASIIVQGATAERILAALSAAGLTDRVVHCADFAEAVGAARNACPVGGTVLLSPGAPSFDQFSDYAARGRRFAELAGFDPASIAEIPGIGIA